MTNGYAMTRIVATNVATTVQIWTNGCACSALGEQTRKARHKSQPEGGTFGARIYLIGNCPGGDATGY